MNLRKRIAWINCKGKRAVSKITHRPVVYRKYNGKQILDGDKANDIIGRAIEKGDPFLAGRIGGSEMNLIWRVDDDISKFDDNGLAAAMNQLHRLSGFFPDDKNLALEFTREMSFAIRQTDLMAVWGQFMEEYVLKKWGDPAYCTLRSIEPWFSSNPWTGSLRGKNVLVVHPFEQTIREQYRIREKLFEDKRILPDFNLETFKAVQTIAGNQDDRFTSWFEALDYMTEGCMSKKFDVAIIGCGAYGLPLAARLKNYGKIAVHMGGCTQLLFGIRGSRWEMPQRENYKKMVNSYWRFAKEVPKNHKSVENGCYW